MGRRIGEALFTGQGTGHSVQQTVQGIHDRQQFFWRIPRSQRRVVFWITLLNGIRQLGQWPKTDHHDQVDQQQQHCKTRQQGHAERQSHVVGNFTAQADLFSHLDPDVVAFQREDMPGPARRIFLPKTSLQWPQAVFWCELGSNQQFTLAVPDLKGQLGFIGMSQGRIHLGVGFAQTGRQRNDHWLFNGRVLYLPSQQGFQHSG